MNNFVRNLVTEWRKLNLPFEDATFVVAVSGGADSVALALALAELKKREKLKLRFVIAHFNHNLRGEESDADENFVRDLAVKNDFELALGHAERLADKKENLEQAARKARYDFLESVGENVHARAILTAHTVNDQAETFLINLIRGSGIEGLSGMKAVRNLESRVEGRNTSFDSQLFLVRPLLNWALRRDTENFCQECGVEFRCDSMNEDLGFRRVRIRRVLLPLLRDFNPKIVETLAQTASLLRDEFEESEKMRQQQEKFEKSGDHDLTIEDLKQLSTAARRRILRVWLEKRRGDLRGLDLKHIEAVERLIFSRKSGRLVELPGSGNISKNGGSLRFEKNLKKIEE